MGSLGFNNYSDVKLRLSRLSRWKDWFQSLLYAHANFYLMLATGSMIFFQDVSLFFLVGGRLNVFQKQVGQVKEVVISSSICL